MRNECELCELKTRLRVYEETDRWIIVDCMACLLPMAVWWGSPLHTMDVSDKDAQDMEKALRSVGEAKLGKDMYIDKVQNQVPDHLHWHARPFNWIPNRIKHKAPDDPEILMWKAKR